MKTLLSKISSALFASVLFVSMAAAQDATKPPTTTTHDGDADRVRHTVIERIKPTLTEEQKALLDANKATQEANRDAFKASITEDQKAILANKSLSKDAKKAAFEASLSDEQKALMAANRDAAKTMHETFKASLTDEQKAKMKNNAHRLRERAKKG